MVEAWASGLTWREIMMDSAMDDGDLARLLRRTIDLLAQVYCQAYGLSITDVCCVSSIFRGILCYHYHLHCDSFGLCSRF
jgi:superfamily II RNA helicase